MQKLLKRFTETALKLPFAMAWDVISLGNMGDGASTTRVLREHQTKKQLDDLVDVLDKVRSLNR